MTDSPMTAPSPAETVTEAMEMVQRLRGKHRVTQFTAGGELKTFDASPSDLDIEAADLIERLIPPYIAGAIAMREEAARVVAAYGHFQDKLSAERAAVGNDTVATDAGAEACEDLVKRIMAIPTPTATPAVTLSEEAAEPSIAELQRDVATATARLARRVLGDPTDSVSGPPRSPA